MRRAGVFQEAWRGSAASQRGPERFKRKVSTPYTIDHEAGAAELVCGAGFTKSIITRGDGQRGWRGRHPRGRRQGRENSHTSECSAGIGHWESGCGGGAIPGLQGFAAGGVGNFLKGARIWFPLISPSVKRAGQGQLWLLVSPSSRRAGQGSRVRHPKVEEAAWWRLRVMAPGFGSP